MIFINFFQQLPKGRLRILKKKGIITLFLIVIEFFCIEPIIPGIDDSKDFKDKTILFCVKTYKNNDILIDPILFLDDGKIVNLPDDLWSIDEKKYYLTENFNSFFYSKKKGYYFFWGGSFKGSISVRFPKQDISCASLTASVDLVSNIKISGDSMALASNKKNFKDLGYRRRIPTIEEKNTASKYLDLICLRNNISMSNMKKIEESIVTVYEQKSGKMLLISSFKAIDSKDYLHSIFFIAEKRLNRFDVTFDWYHSGYEAGVESQCLVDIMDLDNDCIVEVITRFSYYESWDYHIYKRIDNKWKEIFVGGGGGC